jgi:hypothetical protein
LFPKLAMSPPVVAATINTTLYIKKPSRARRNKQTAPGRGSVSATEQVPGFA